MVIQHKFAHTCLANEEPCSIGGLHQQDTRSIGTCCCKSTIKRFAAAQIPSVLVGSQCLLIECWCSKGGLLEQVSQMQGKGGSWKKAGG